MDKDLLGEADFLRELFDAVPAMLLVVDEDVRILHVNAAAATGFGLDLREIHRKRGGEVLHCIHSTAVPAGCGRAPACADCVVRNAVAGAASGGKTFRKATRMELGAGPTKAEVHLVVSAAPFAHGGRRYVLLTLENVSELIRLKSLLPICSYCKKIRDDDGYWNEIAEYLNAHLDVDFSHGICTGCLAKHFPETAERLRQEDAAP
jgi:hypothetical protein